MPEVSKELEAVDDRDARFSHVAFRWDRDCEAWQFLCAGRTEDECRQRVRYWVGKGQEASDIREYVTRSDPAVHKELEAARRLHATLKHMVRWWDQLKPADIDWAKEDLEETAWVEEIPEASVDTSAT